MKKDQPTNAQGTLSPVLRIISMMLRNLFQSPSNREFRRLKDFIAS